MNKNYVVNLVLTGCIAGSVFFERYFGYPFFSGCCCGAAGMLMILNYFGQRQLNKAGHRLDKAIKDRIVAIESDNLTIEADD